jgi:hypothetical protein
MDNAVALVQAYLHVNGYFTVTEYPILEALKDGNYRADIDILACRFPGAGLLVSSSGGTGRESIEIFAPDPELGIPSSHDMIIGEVKEGPAQMNKATRDPSVLSVVLTRFGCCSAADVPRVVRTLLRQGSAMTPCGHHIRMVAFGSTPTNLKDQPREVISMRHVVRFLQSYVRHHCDVLHHAQFRDPAIGFLVTIEKALGSASHIVDEKTLPLRTEQSFSREPLGASHESTDHELRAL